MKSLLSTPAPDFDHPLEMLAACHDRIEDRIDVLQRLLDHLPTRGCDEQARQAAANVMRYFDTAGEHHHEDEEADLFPALIAADPQRTRELVARLRSDHTAMRSLWQGLREQLVPITAGTSTSLDSERVREFSALYEKHIALEESELLPLAEKLLTTAQQAALGAQMAQRRGVRL
jgi:hemerythrin-like domain-containing protein